MHADLGEFPDCIERPLPRAEVLWAIPLSASVVRKSVGWACGFKSNRDALPSPAYIPAMEKSEGRTWL